MTNPRIIKMVLFLWLNVCNVIGNLVSYRAILITYGYQLPNSLSFHPTSLFLLYHLKT
jgi:hypothetical protein